MEKSDQRRALVAIGANLPGLAGETPLMTCRLAVCFMIEAGLQVQRLSRWYQSRPWPLSDQPDYINGVLELKTSLSPDEMLAALHDIEQSFGRVRSVPNAARIVDLDLLDMDGLVQRGDKPGTIAVLPHPRMHERSFVLRPLAELYPQWRHPITGLSINRLIKELSPEQEAKPI